MMPDSTASSNADASLTMHRGRMVHAIRSWSYVLALRWLSASVNKPAILLAVAVMLSVTVTCIAAMWYARFDLPLTLFCIYLWQFFGAVYMWRRLRARYQHAVLRRGLGYAAAGLGVFLSAIILYSFVRVIPLPQAMGVWLLALLVAYCLYRVIILHIEEEEGVEVQLQAQANRGVRPLV